MRPPARGFALLLAAALAAATRAADDVYFPPKGAWEERPPSALGLDPQKLGQAVAYSVAHESSGSRDIATDLAQTFGKHEPLWRLLGPTQPRGPVTGLIVHHGRVAAHWGDPDRVDMTHSVTKTFLTTVVGLAWTDGRLASLSAPVRATLPGEPNFESTHDAPITWDDLLRQTSDWSGTLWGIPDWADRPVDADPEKARNRAMHAPGTFFKYNDVRVNLLALVGLEVWRRPLPDVLRERIMDPIGASSTWHWEGYSTSWVDIDGRRMQSVSGGGHFGGGMFINAWDMARFGYLFLEKGSWAGRRLVAESWIALARTPGPANPGYGFANWYLNPGRKFIPAAPASSVVFVGNGTNAIYVDWENDLVVVVRWIDGRDLDPFLGRVLGAMGGPEARS
jgi:CubicO group peptidase (beta-lactamase class C family)